MKHIKEVRLAIVLLLAGATAVFSDGVNSGQPIPYLTNDEASAEFLAESIAKSIVKAEFQGVKKKEQKALIASVQNNYLEYGRKLALTLSELTPAEQNVVWYGE